jgi:signal transduction histidine kinase
MPRKKPEPLRARVETLEKKLAREVARRRRAQIAVADTGVGITEKDQDAVFEEFRQVGAADKKMEGTGLGLPLARKFDELHGGRLWLKSHVGGGSTFTLPLVTS